MNEIRQQSIIGMILLFLLISTHIFAYDTVIDGLRYEWKNTHITSGEEVIWLVGYSSSKISDSITIPNRLRWVSNDAKNRTQCIVRAVGANAFLNCSIIKSVNFNLVNNVYERSFKNCSSLKAIYFDGVKNIHSEAFVGCSSLTEIHLKTKTPPSVNEDSFDEETYKNAILFVPEGTIEVYTNSETWNKFEKISDGTTTKSSFQLNISSSGSGGVTYNGSTIQNSTQSFTVREGTSATVSFAPDNGYRIANVKVNDTDVTSSVTNNQYTISNITANTTLSVTFEAIPVTTYTLSVTASGNGSATYNGATIKGNTQSFTVEEGTSAIVSFTSDSGCCIACVKVNDIDVTSNVTNNQYTISNISTNMTLAVTFEAIPPTTYTLSVTATGNGSATYNGTAIKSNTQSFTVEDGASATVSFTPDSGYRIASVKLNDTDVTSSVASNQYTISNIKANTTLSVTFEAIPPTTYTLSVTASGNGNVTYNGTTIKGNTQSFTVEEGASAAVSFTPDSGYRIASVKVNDNDVTSIVSNNQYTISNIKANTTLSVTFEAIPVTTYTLSIIASGSGYASYDSSTIRNKTSSFSVNEGTSVTVSFTPDSGYRIASVKVNNTDVTSKVTYNQYTISNVKANVTLEVTFEAIPPTVYSLSITTKGNGKATYLGTDVRDIGASFDIEEGTSATISFTPDSGYRIASVKVNNTDVTSSVSNSQYTISSITGNTSVEVNFEAIPPTTYTLSITAVGNGSAVYSNTTIKNQVRTFTVNEGASATVIFTADTGYRIASVKVNNTTVTSLVSNNKYTISNIKANTTLVVSFEAIPVTAYTLTVKASGNGSAMYEGTAVKNQTKRFSVNEGSNATITFSPDNGNRINSVKLNSTDITAQAQNNWYTISSIKANTTIEVAFVEDINALTAGGVNYTVVSQADRTVKVAGGNYGQVLTVPEKLTASGYTWTVTGIDTDALKGNAELAAVIWNPTAQFTAEVSNPNLLLYVKAESYAPSAIKNVVVNSSANSITLVDAASGNSFYCPKAFIALHISYTHNYSMATGLGTSQGWETIALPFNVETISHITKGSMVPFANWNGNDTQKPFWLYELTASGFREASAIKAYKPYIISMPNNPKYDEKWQLKGKVTFSAASVRIEKTGDAQTAAYQNRTFVPNFADRAESEGLYALNVNNDLAQNNSGMTEGSRFVLNMRQIHPFEAYMMTDANVAPLSIGIFEDMTTSIRTIGHEEWTVVNGVYDLQGRKVQQMKKGVYIKNGKKIIVK